MRVARLRCFVWMLILVLSAGLAAPGFASISETGRPGVTHVHADGSVHTHGAVLASYGARADAGAWPAKAPLHCPGCATAAECAVFCFGVAVLPTAVLIPAYSLAQAWISADFTTPSGVAPSGDLDPPRPVSVR